MIPNLVTALRCSYDFRKGVMNRLLAYEVAKMAWAVKVDFMSEYERKTQINPSRDFFPDVTTVHDLTQKGYGITIMGKDTHLLKQRFEDPKKYEESVGRHSKLNLFMIITDLKQETMLRWPTSRYFVDAYMDWPKGGSSRELLTQLECIGMFYDMPHVVDNALTVIVPSPTRSARQDHAPIIYEELFHQLVEPVQVADGTNGYRIAYINLHEDAFVVHDIGIESLATMSMLDDDALSKKSELVVILELPLNVVHQGRNGNEHPTSGPEDMFLVAKVPV